MLYNILYVRFYAAGIYLGFFKRIKKNQLLFYVLDFFFGDDNNRLDKNTYNFLKLDKNAFHNDHNLSNKNNSSLIASDYFSVFSSGNANFLNRNNHSLANLNFLFVFDSNHVKNNSSKNNVVFVELGRNNID